MQSQAILEFKKVPYEALTLPTIPNWTSLGGSFRGIPIPLFYAGSLFSFVRNQDNTLGMCAVNGTSGQWYAFGGTLVSPPAVAPSPDGTVAVIGLMQSGQLQISYLNPFAGSATNWASFAGGTPSGVSFSTTMPPVLAVNANARLEAFAVDTKGTMWHTYQTTVSPPITWSNWSKLGSGFNPNALLFLVYLLKNTGQLQAVALGNDNNMYQSTQYQSGGYDGWGAFTPVGQGPSPSPQFTGGPAACFCTVNNYAVYGGYNSNAGVSSNPLVYLAPPSSPPYSMSWTNFNLASAQYPIANAVPVMVSNNGTPQIAWQSLTAGQVLFVSQTQGVVGQWGPIQNVGDQKGMLTGQMSGVVIGSNLALLQCGSNGSLFYINYAPPTT